MTSRATARLLLAHTVEPGDRRLHKMLFQETPEQIWEQITAASDRVPSSWLASALRAEDAVAESLDRANSAGLSWWTPEDAHWPESLNDLGAFQGISDVAGAPLGLWVLGDADPSIIFARTLAIVGARSCTTYGAQLATEIAAESAEGGFTIVSGAAFGIDACAHRGALAVNQATIAVMACGADVDYPRAHAALIGRIAENGLVISEYPPGSAARKQRFLARNRIIAALAEGLVVVEAAARSGSLNTLHWADQLGRATFAVPGPVTSGASVGTHAALRDGKAVLATSGLDILTDLGAVH